jgi:hypothetical protein
MNGAALQNNDAMADHIASGYAIEERLSLTDPAVCLETPNSH